MYLPTISHAARIGIALAASVAVAAPAIAVPLSYSENFLLQFPLPPLIENQFPFTFELQSIVPDISLPRFDASLGTLDSVDISFETGYAHKITANGSIDAYFLSSLSVKLPELGLVQGHFVGQQSVCGGTGSIFPCPPGNTVSQLDGYFSDSFDLSAVPLSSFIGSNSLDFSLATIIAVDAECTAGHDCSLSTLLPWGGTVTVSYDYTPIGGGEPPTSVPEPAPLALLASGLLMGAVARRFSGTRRRRQ